MQRNLIVAIVVVVICVAVYAADPKTDALNHIDQGKAALQADKAQEAIGHLQKAISLIQKTMMSGFAAFLPDVWEGWEAKEPKSTSGSWGSGEDAFQWMQVERQYTRKEDKLRAEIQITSMPQLIMGYRASMQQFKNPMVREMLTKDPDLTVEFIDADGWVGLLQAKKGRNAECTAVHEKIAITIRIRKDDMALLKKFWEAVDRKGLAGAMK
jgi:hypothetical protein